MRKLILSLLLAVAIIVPAEATLRNTQRFEFFDNVGGLNDKFSPVSIADDESSDLQNVNYTVGGAIQKRKGFSSDNSAYLAGAVTGLFEHTNTSGTRFLIATGGDKIYKYDSLDGIPDDITGGVTIASSSTTLFDFVTANGNMIATNQTNPVIRWTGGATVNTIATAPQGQWIAFHQNITFVGNTITDTTGASDVQPSRVYFSNVKDEITWTSTDFIDVGKDDGQEITGLVPMLDTLYIFKDDSIYRLSGTNRDDFVLSLMVNGMGCVGGHTIQIIDNRFLFQDTDGFYIYDGGINVRKISTKIEGTLDGINESRNPQNVSANFKRLNQYWCGVANGASSVTNLILVYDYFHDAWTKYVGIPAQAFTTVLDTNSKEQLYHGDFNLGAVFLQEDGDNDFGQPINAYYQTKWYRFPQIVQSEKVWRLLRVFAEDDGNWDLTIEMKKDFSSSSTSDTMTLTGTGGVWGTAIWGTDVWGGDQVIIGRFHPELRENFFQLRFSNSGLDETFKVLGYQMFIEPQQRI